jgi:hypothetical protein
MKKRIIPFLMIAISSAVGAVESTGDLTTGDLTTGGARKNTQGVSTNKAPGAGLLDVEKEKYKLGFKAAKWVKKYTGENLKDLESISSVDKWLVDYVTKRMNKIPYRNQRNAWTFGYTHGLRKGYFKDTLMEKIGEILQDGMPSYWTKTDYKTPTAADINASEDNLIGLISKLHDSIGLMEKPTLELRELYALNKNLDTLNKLLKNLQNIKECHEIKYNFLRHLTFDTDQNNFINFDLLARKYCNGLCKGISDSGISDFLIVNSTDPETSAHYAGSKSNILTQQFVQSKKRNKESVKKFNINPNDNDYQDFRRKTFIGMPYSEIDCLGLLTAVRELPGQGSVGIVLPGHKVALRYFDGVVMYSDPNFSSMAHVIESASGLQKALHRTHTMIKCELNSSTIQIYDLPEDVIAKNFPKYRSLSNFQYRKEKALINNEEVSFYNEAKQKIDAIDALIKEKTDAIMALWQEDAASRILVESILNEAQEKLDLIYRARKEEIASIEAEKFYDLARKTAAINMAYAKNNKDRDEVIAEKNKSLARITALETKREEDMARLKAEQKEALDDMVSVKAQRDKDENMVKAKKDENLAQILKINHGSKLLSYLDKMKPSYNYEEESSEEEKKE